MRLGLCAPLGNPLPGSREPFTLFLGFGDHKSDEAIEIKEAFNEAIDDYKHETQDHNWEKEWEQEYRDPPRFNVNGTGSTVQKDSTTALANLAPASTSS